MYDRSSNCYFASLHQIELEYLLTCVILIQVLDVEREETLP